MILVDVVVFGGEDPLVGNPSLFYVARSQTGTRVGRPGRRDVTGMGSKLKPIIHSTGGC